MDLNVLPLAEVDLKIGDDAIKFDNDDKPDFSEITPSFDPEAFDVRNNLNFIKQEVENFEDVNFHFLTRNHSKPNDPVRRFQCEECGKYFIRNEHLKNHRRTHTGERPFECDLCQRSFAKHFDLNRHKQYVHGSVTTFFICEECGRTFSRKDHLKSHLVTHKNRTVKLEEANDVSALLNTFACETCGRTYYRHENLKKHMQKHCESNDGSDCDSKNLINDLKDESANGNLFKGINFHFMSANDVEPRVDNTLRPFSCEYCGRLFVRKDHLKNHERTHTGERPFQCDHCDRRFAKRFVMTRHLQNVHRINTKMHKCPDCDRKFARTDHLKTHMKIHILASVRSQNKDKLHKCEECGREFTRSDNLKTHMKIHLLAAAKKQQEEERGHVEGEYVCTLCEKTFTDFEKFTNHEKKHKKMPEDRS